MSLRVKRAGVRVAGLGLVAPALRCHASLVALASALLLSPSSAALAQIRIEPPPFDPPPPISARCTKDLASTGDLGSNLRHNGIRDAEKISIQLKRAECTSDDLIQFLKDHGFRVHETYEARGLDIVRLLRNDDDVLDWLFGFYIYINLGFTEDSKLEEVAIGNSGFF